MNEPEKIPEPLLQRLHSELGGGEVVLWAGQPILGQFGRKGAFLLTAIYSQGIIFSLFILYKPLKHSDIFSLPGLSGLFIFGFCSFLILKAFRGMGRAKDIVYAITSKRAIVMDCADKSMVTSYLPEKITNPSREERPDGSGDLLLAREEVSATNGEKITVSRYFYAVRNVKDVERRLFEMLERARA